jgi:hypothetical protein
MKSYNLFCKIISASLLFICAIGNAQQSLWFGTVKIQGKIIQGRFEIFSDSTIKSIVYAPYGISPTTFQSVSHQKGQLAFAWQVNQFAFHCLLFKQGSSAYAGNCMCEGRPPIQLVIREFTKADAILQGDSLPAAETDIQILERALNLVNNGNNWNRFDNRVCDVSSYPYKWSLFCALHQASIDIDSEYKHLRPAMQAARQAINEITSGKKYAHLLQDYNNEAQSFDSVAKVLNRAKEIIIDKMKLRRR